MLHSRIAPTPSGYLHLGNAVNFALTWEHVRAEGGKVGLRIDDFDPQRPRAEYVEDIFRCLHWLEITPDWGPRDQVELKTQYSQQLRQEIYWAKAEALLAAGKAYACACTRTTPGAYDEMGSYRGKCRALGHTFVRGRFALRLNTPSLRADWQRTLYDFVIWTRGDFAAYQLVSVLEDQAAGVNLIVRGEDLRHSSGAQRYLARELDGEFGAWEKDLQILHHATLPDPQNPGEKLSKSNRAQSLREFIARGFTREDLRALVEATRKTLA